MKIRVRTQGSGGSRSFYYNDVVKIEQRGTRLVVSRTMDKASSWELSALVSIEIQGEQQ